MTQRSWQKSKVSPDILDETKNGETIMLSFVADHDLFQFQGHFPDQPVLPGVAQLDWAVLFAKERFSGLGQIHEVAQLKYKRLIRPGDRLSLKLDYQRKKGQVVFNYSIDGDACSSGIIKFKGAE